MRLWSIHPKHLDSVGLTACWREGLLARKVLLGETIGYKNHPQLIRFKNSENAVFAIDNFLIGIYNEAKSRGYNYDRTKIGEPNPEIKISVNKGQFDYELKHLKNKLEKRNPDFYKKLLSDETIDVHPMFYIVNGSIEAWEIINSQSP